MVSTTIGTAHPKARVKLVHAARGKRARAEPVSALYEQHKAHHVGTHPKLEDEMTTWAAMSGEKSPNRIDALVWAITELVFENVAPAEISRAKRFRKALPSTRV
jgi:phage terminase large subunit-like protein